MEWLRMSNALTSFISNKTNLVIIQCILYFIIGWALKSYGISMMHMTLICVMMITISFLNHLLGVSKGIFIATVHKKELNAFMKILDGYEKDGETIDLKKIDDIIKDEFNEENNEEDNN